MEAFPFNIRGEDLKPLSVNIAVLKCIDGYDKCVSS